MMVKNMKRIYCIVFVIFHTMSLSAQKKENETVKIVQELFRLRNEHKADLAEQYYADIVKVYMKYLRNIPRRTITQSDKKFWKAHPNNRFEITAPVQITVVAGNTIAIIFGKEYLDGTSFKSEKIEIKFDRNRKIYSYRGFSLK
jgi:hypothetical protein